MNLRDVPREMKELPIGLLDPPALDSRIARDPEKLDELTNDIAKRGVIQPIAVVRTGERFEIVAGRTRHICALRAGLVTMPCVIYPTKDIALEGVKYAENLFRLEMSPAEEALFFHELFEHECGKDFDRLCALVNRKPAYVNSRFDLISGDAEIFEAVRANKIPLGVAAELNKIPAQDYRRYYLTLAIRDGVTVSTVVGWVQQWKTLYEGRPDAPASSVVASSAPLAHAYDPYYCAICRKSDPRFVPEQLSVHTHCKIAILEPLLDSYHGNDSQS